MAIIDAPIALLFIVIIFVMSVPLGVARPGRGHRDARRRLRHRAQDEAADRSRRRSSSTEAQRYASTTLKNAQVIEAMGMMENIRDRWLDAAAQVPRPGRPIASDHAGERRGDVEVHPDRAELDGARASPAG